VVPAARFIWLLLASVAGATALGQPASPGPPPDVQHFGLLVVVAFHDDAPDPVTFRGDLLGDNQEERMRALRAMGIESSPELRELWTDFLHDHAGEGADKGVMQFISGGMLEWNFGEPGSKQAVLGAGFDEQTERPLELSAIFNLKDGRWRHVATIACRCQMSDDAEPFNLHPGRPLPAQEWIVSLHIRNEQANEYHREEIRFRLRNERLWPLIQFESWGMNCPQGYPLGPNCHVIETNLEPARLAGTNREQIPGFVLISWSGSPLQNEMAAMKLNNPSCKPYTWDETSFSYFPSQLKPVTCGHSAPPPAHRIQPHSEPNPASK